MIFPGLDLFLPCAATRILFLLESCGVLHAHVSVHQYVVLTCYQVTIDVCYLPKREKKLIDVSATLVTMLSSSTVTETNGINVSCLSQAGLLTSYVLKGLYFGKYGS